MRSKTEGGDEHVLSIELNTIAASIRNSGTPQCRALDYTGADRPNRWFTADVL
jgi:hypothetical protein